MQNNRITGMDELLPAQRDLISSYLQLTGLRSVVVGSQLGRSDWDIRPLILNDNQTLILRLSDPTLLTSMGGLNRLWLEYQELAQLPGLIGHGVQFGQSSGRMWFLRPYHSETLSAPGLLTQLRSQHGRDVIVKMILDQVRTLHSRNLVHGNICLNNLAFVEGRLVLLDYGIDAQAHTQQLSRIPELKMRGNLGVQADIFSLGILLPQILGPDESAQKKMLLNAMTHAEPQVRPSIDEVYLELFPNTVIQRTESKPRHIISGVQLEPQETVRSGKLISPGSGMTRVRSGSLTNISREEFLSRVLEEEEANNLATQEHEDVREKDSDSLKGESPQTLHFALVSLVFLVVSALYGAGAFQIQGSSKEQVIPFGEYWVSDQATLMSEVARAAAFEKNERARRVILSDVQSGTNRTGVNSTLLRAASNRLWYNSFRERDKSLLFKIALIGLMPEALDNAPALNKAHPGLIFGILASLSPTQDQGWYQSVKVGKLSSLPAPLGSAFGSLEKLGVETLADPAPRALAHLLVGRISKEALLAFSPEGEGTQITSQKLQILLPLLLKNEALAASFIKALGTAPSGVQVLLDWFQKGGLGSWEKVPSIKRLLIAGGELPEGDLSFEQYADLLRYPVLSIREQSGIYLGKSFFEEQDLNTIAFLASTTSELTRVQTVSLLAALRLEGEPSFTFISKWFDTSPPARSVLGIVLTRKSISKFDALSVDAARYLKDKDWGASLNELAAAIDHPETLVRALVYARLNAKDAQHARLLEAMVKREPDLKLRAQVQAKLDDART